MNRWLIQQNRSVANGPRETVSPAVAAAGGWPGVKRALAWLVVGGVLALQVCEAAPVLLKPTSFAHYSERFNGMEDENFTNTIPNAAAWTWMQGQIPFFECPDPEIEELYYFRWWSFRKHLVQTTNGWVVTEFLTPVRHAGTANTISCALGFHLAEGRWLHDPAYLDDYTRFWLRGNAGQAQPHLHKFSGWLAAAVYDRFTVTGDRSWVTGWLPDLVADFHVWEKERQSPNGLFWQYDVRDGMEESISGSRTNQNQRPTINSYQFANARAIAQMARLAGDQALADEFTAQAECLKQLVQARLWNPADRFFEVLHPNGQLAGVREELGFIPWMFHLPDNQPGYVAAWNQLMDPQGFSAPYGVMTAERRHPQFRSHGVGKCEWDGAVWPFATSQTLYALANVLRDYAQTNVSNHDYFEVFRTYAHSQHAEGRPYIGEYLDETTGAWINGKNGRSRYYNHSTFADLLITGVVGLRPRADAMVEIVPLLPAGTWNYFCLDDVLYHGHRLTIFWDQDGTRYQHGKGLVVLADGKEIARGPKLEKLTAQLP